MVKNKKLVGKYERKIKSWPFSFQIMIHDENGDSLDTANNLRAKFEALQMQDKSKEAAKEAAAKFKVKRFKVLTYLGLKANMKL